MLALQDILSDTYQKSAQFNTAVNQTDNNGPMGVEPTTLAQ